MSSKIEKKKKKKRKMSQSDGHFLILTRDNYEQTNGVQLEFCYTRPMLGIPQQTEGLSRHKCHQRL